MSDLSWGELHKHAQHDQKTHGNWANGISAGDILAGSQGRFEVVAVTRPDGNKPAKAKIFDVKTRKTFEMDLKDVSVERTGLTDTGGVRRFVGKHAQHDQKAHGNWAKKLLKPFSSGSNPKSRRKGEPEEWTGYEATSSLPASSTILSQKGKKGEAVTVSLERWLEEAPIGSTLHMNRDERKPVVYTITESGPVKGKKIMNKSWQELHKHANHDQKSHGNWSKGRRKGKPENWTGYEDDAYEPGFGLEVDDGEYGRADYSVDAGMTWERWEAEAPVGSRMEMWRDDSGQPDVYVITDSGMKRLGKQPSQYKKRRPLGKK